MIGLWIKNHFKKKNIERAERIVLRMTTEEILYSGERSEELKDGVSEVLLKELSKRLIKNEFT